MVRYRPHRGSLNDAMAEMRSFDSIEEMFHYIVEEWKVWGNDELAGYIRGIVDFDLELRKVLEKGDQVKQTPQ